MDKPKRTLLSKVKNALLGTDVKKAAEEQANATQELSLSMSDLDAIRKAYDEKIIEEETKARLLKKKKAEEVA